MGLRSALDTPAVIERDLDGLLGAPRTGGGAGLRPSRHPELPLRSARLMIRLLGRLPGGRWRNTCLYRSVAECLTLRRLGVPARVCLGVEKEEALRSITAHAWIEVIDAEGAATSPPRGMTRLARARERSPRIEADDRSHRRSIPDSARETRSLLQDDSLTLKYEPDLSPLVERWLPRLPRVAAPAVAAQHEAAAVEVRIGEAPDAAEARGEPTLRLGTVRAWIADGAERAVLVGKTAACRGLVDLRRRQAEIDVSPLYNIDNDIGSSIEANSRARPAISDSISADENEHSPLLSDFYSMLTIAAALLLGRLGRALIHAAAVVQPDGTAWLIAGDARSGKSTTCANLLAAGWDYVSDDQGVLTETESRQLQIEGWPRDFHLDAGWERGVPSDERRVVEASSLGSGGWRRTAPVHGVLLPYVARGRRTELQPAGPGDALVALVRQAPWLMADRSAAPRCLDLLRSTAERPAFRLALGLDTFRDPERLASLLEGVAV